MSKPMNFEEFNSLIRHIRDEHSPAGWPKVGRVVKYVDPNIDMRDGKVFAVTFRGYSWKEMFHTQNECRDLPESLFDRCMSFLDTKESDHG